MKILILLATILFAQKLFAGTGDTITVQTFTPGWPLNPGWNSPKEGHFIFPSDTIRFEKILMYYKLTCDPAQSPACGEWDYLTYTNLFEHPGIKDSTLLSHANFTVNGSTPDSIMLMTSPSWNYFPHFQYNIVYTDTLNFNNYNIGNGILNISVPFGNGNPDSRTQFMWRKTELQAAGITVGAINGIKIFANNSTGIIKNLCIKIKTSVPDSLNEKLPVIDGFITVYSKNTTLIPNSWNTINFTTPFTWNGTSNLVFDISFTENTGSATIAADSASWISSLIATTPEYVLNFDGNDYVNVPQEVFTGMDSSVTISFWQYGNPAIQPHADIIFEGIDSTGYRVLNAHLPWDDGKVYWDAGNVNENYDRITKATTGPSAYEGKWNHWAFTKDVHTGQMKMYLNGVLISLGSGKYRLMKGIKQFKIGCSGNGLTNNYHGQIDDFCIWDRALDLNTIKGLLYKKIDNTHPMYSHLKAYYRFNEGQGTTTMNETNALAANLVGYPNWKSYEGNRIKDFSKSHLRPNIIFEQGNFTAHNDSILLIDTIQKSQIMVVQYGDTIHPNVATDTLYAWPTYYNYHFNSSGHAIDSTFITPQLTLHKKVRNYFSAPFEKLNRYELGRYITPYGNGLDLGLGWTWIYDVTDFRHLLKDTVHLTAGNFQEQLDLKFIMIKGTPPRDVVKIENVWQGDFALNTFDLTVPPKTIDLNPVANMFKLRTTVTGHQFDNATNCAEFCPKIHSLDVNGITRYNWQIVQECSKNPLYPQGGTWIYARAGWCPGMPGATKHWELSPFVTGSQLTLDYNSEYDDFGNYVTETQLVSYTNPNFNYDAAIDEIISPSRYELKGRMNPICGRPVLKIKNTGANALTSLNIAYKFEGDTFYHYQWTGTLGFLETEEVALPPMNWNSAFAGSKTFVANISNPSGHNDEYSFNNTMKSHFELASIFNEPVIIQFKTNSFANENHYEVYDVLGNIVHSKSVFTNNTVYEDTLSLSPGCYEFVMTDADEDGIAWWANSDGTGYLKLKLANSGTIVKTFNPDFGSETRFQFSVTVPTGLNYLPDYEGKLLVYPNPSEGKFTLDFSGMTMKNANLELINIIGQTEYLNRFSTNDSGKFEIDLSKMKKGIYILKINTDSKSWMQKIVIK